MAYLLSLSKRLPDFLEAQKKRSWNKNANRHKAIHLDEATIMIVGAGGIGQEVGRLCKAFNMKVIGVDPKFEKLKYFDKLITQKEIEKEINALTKNMIMLNLIALFFMLFGTILGGIWADQSWGRFWGWDPKENAALLIVMWQILIIHLRISGLIKPLEFAFGMIISNIFLAFGWFGVNLLGVGLHSYGFTDSIATNLALFILFELWFAIGIYFLIKDTDASRKN